MCYTTQKVDICPLRCLLANSHWVFNDCWILIGWSWPYCFFRYDFIIVHPIEGWQTERQSMQRLHLIVKWSVEFEAFYLYSSGSSTWWNHLKLWHMHAASDAAISVCQVCQAAWWSDKAFKSCFSETGHTHSNWLTCLVLLHLKKQSQPLLGLLPACFFFGVFKKYING